jgi:plastocyanin
MTFAHRAWRLALVAGLLLIAGSVAAPVLAQGGAVSIVGTSFQPATITVAVGDTVTWTVTQSIGQQHSVTSGKPGGADIGKEFDSGFTLQDNGQSYQFTFQNAGTYDYFCQVHPTTMIGQVVVTGASGSALPASAAPSSPAPASAAPASAAPASEAPAASGQPAASPAGSPAATPPPVSPEAGEPLPPENKLIAAGVLGVALVLLFAASWYWRRLNPA